MAVKIPKRIAMSLINSLKGGVVPRTGLGYIAVGRETEINALLHDVDIVEDGGAAFRFIVGKYGSGKSFLLQTMRQHVMDRGFVVIDADFSPERRFSGTKGQGLATYRELMENMSTKTRPDGGALPLILEKWISSVQAKVISEGISPDSSGFHSRVESEIFAVANRLEGMVSGFEFAKVISAYYKAAREGDEMRKSAALRWLRGEYSTKTEARQDLGITTIITDENWYEYVKLFAAFLVFAGYKGLIMMVDELVNISNIPHSITRQYNYEKILAMYNDALQGKAKHLGIIMCGTPACVEDKRRGIFSYEALRSRLDRGRFSTDDTRDMLAPIIRLAPLGYEEMTVLTEKLSEIHADLYGYGKRLTEDDLVRFIKLEYERIGADKNITPREVIRDFIELLNIVSQNPDKPVDEIMGGGFEYAKPVPEGGTVGGEFAEFSL